MLLSIFKIKKNNSKGFTLIETITVVAIVSILSVVAIAGYQSSQKQQSVQRTAHQLAGDIRRAQNMAMASVEQEGVIPDGYGIYIDKNDPNFDYVLYAEDNSNQTYQPTDFEVEEINLPSGVEIDTILPAPNSHVSIFFEPPDPTTYINGDSSAGKFTEIKLKFSGSTYEKTVIVKTSGQIEIN